MKNWKEFKEEYKASSSDNAFEMETIEEIATIISEYVKAREEKGITQGELAELTGLKQSALSRLEGMKGIPQLDTMVKVLRPLGLKLVVEKNALI